MHTQRTHELTLTNSVNDDNSCAHTALTHTHSHTAKGAVFRQAAHSALSSFASCNKIRSKHCCVCVCVSPRFQSTATESMCVCECASQLQPSETELSAKVECLQTWSCLSGQRAQVQQQQQSQWAFAAFTEQSVQANFVPALVGFERQQQQQSKMKPKRRE